jgi:hypothetical protein
MIRGLGAVPGAPQGGVRMARPTTAGISAWLTIQQMPNSVPVPSGRGMVPTSQTR